MADVIFQRGPSEKIEKVNIVDGQILVTTDTGEMYIDIKDIDSEEATRKNISKTQVQLITWEDEE